MQSFRAFLRVCGDAASLSDLLATFDGFPSGYVVTLQIHPPIAFPGARHPGSKRNVVHAYIKVRVHEIIFSAYVWSWVLTGWS